jgi:hypothetical protein
MEVDTSVMIILVLSWNTYTTAQVKEHAVPPCLVLVINDNLYGLTIALSYI